MGQILSQIQERVKFSVSAVALFLFRLVTGFMIGFTLALALDEAMGLGQLLFVFVILGALGVFMRVTKHWKFMGVLVFNLFCILSGLLIRMYILLAPGA